MEFNAGKPEVVIAQFDDVGGEARSKKLRAALSAALAFLVWQVHFDCLRCGSFACCPVAAIGSLAGWFWRLTFFVGFDSSVRTAAATFAGSTLDRIDDE